MLASGLKQFTEKIRDAGSDIVRLKHEIDQSNFELSDLL